MQDDRTQPPTAYGGPFNVLNQPSDSGTTHMSIVDGAALTPCRCKCLLDLLGDSVLCNRLPYTLQICFTISMSGPSLLLTSHASEIMLLAHHIIGSLIAFIASACKLSKLSSSAMLDTSMGFNSAVLHGLTARLCPLIGHWRYSSRHIAFMQSRQACCLSCCQQCCP